MYFQCVLILALNLVENEAAQRFSYSQRSGPSRVFRSGSPKVIQGSFDTAAELARLIQKVKQEAADKKDQSLFQPIEAPVPTPENEPNYLQALLKVIQKQLNGDEGIRIQVVKNTDVLDRYKKDLGTRAVFIDNPEVLEKYVDELNNKKPNYAQPVADFEKLLLKRRNAMFRLELPENISDDQLSNDKPTNIEDNKQKKKHYDGASNDITKRFNANSKKNKEKQWEMGTGKKMRAPDDQKREVRKGVKENIRPKNERENRGYKNDREDRGYKNDREDRGYKNDREDRGYKKERDDRGYKNNREDRGYKNERGSNKFKDYPDFKSPGNPNLGRIKTTKDYGYDMPRKPKKAPRDYDDGFNNKKKVMNKDKFDDYGMGKKKDRGRGESIASDSMKKPKERDTNWNEKRNFNSNNERRRPRNDGWAPSIRGSNDNSARSSNNNEGRAFGNTAIPFKRPSDIYVNDHGE